MASAGTVSTGMVLASSQSAGSEPTANQAMSQQSSEAVVTAASADGGEIYASRLFAGPEDYPPTDFAAYGILAFKYRASNHDRARHLMICEAYVNSIRSSKAVSSPRQQQMVTVWPMSSRSAAEKLMDMEEASVCGVAVDQYGSVNADRALRQAAAAGADLKGLGPYLLAWSPPQKKGKQDAVVLIADLSDVKDYEGALAAMLGWVQDIESDPKLWGAKGGWTVEALRLKMQRWFDKRGTQLLSVVGRS